ncbi:TBC1 domain family member 13-like protein [Trifolium pratense]|uniref:TBC1 domain family member 13-like protein n=1 Tax=Trifolium pratense TaxID=57577 RepID=A0A2K3MZQ5_TRIPR|nr:TBC1 domain family member 13-like protein [Trifolium pratense]
MAKKRVPDWLNSPLWSSPSEQHRFSSAVPEPPEQPPSPPPLTIKQDPPSIQHSRTNHNHNHNAIAIATSSSSSSASTSSADENSHSRQAQSQANLLAELSRKVIDMRELRRIASQGIPDVSGLRSTVWKIFLGYLPPDRGLWSSELAKKRSQYKRFKQEILINPSEITRRMCNSGNYDADEVKCETRGILSRSQITHGEHPLSLGKTSIWNQFFQDTDIIEQIDRDVKRTHPDMPFFCGDSQLAKSNQEALKNILIIFAKLNPGIRYVQGMNEVLAPLFYVFKNDPDEENAVSIYPCELSLTALSL